ncbi:SID1 transmembrane family member 1-like isoform X2 [Harmonia axyridis]|nr:SID1 transmembrane family member 1-like isoform X2 [Harmonia axyridis]
MSWEIPYRIPIGKRSEVFFMNTSRTVCHQAMDNINKLSKEELLKTNSSELFLQHFFVSVSTPSNSFVDVHIQAEEEKDFIVRENVKYTLSVTASASRYVYYKFEGNEETVIVQITSPDDVCLAVSVQDSDCPVFDLNENIKYQGKYQSITRRGAITVDKQEFKHGFFLVFIARPNNYECNMETKKKVKSGLLRVTDKFPDRTSTVSFKVNRALSAMDYFKPMFISLGGLLIMLLLDIGLVYIFSNYGSFKDVIDLEDQEEQIQDELQKRNTTEINDLLKTPKLNVKMISKYPVKTKKRSLNYLWHVLSISIFYSIPVVQLVATYQRMVNKTGNQDLCYYNFSCAHPLFGFSDFNHIFSNTGYLVLGALFICVVLHRHKTIPERKGVGIPEHYGLYYAMGVSLIIEGILSGCYHICPSQSNYQFDTSFMYIMAVLCSVKLYQNRHPDINVTAYSTFTILGFIIFVAMIGILHGHILIWLAFYIGYIALCMYVSFKIYFLGYVFQGFKKVEEEIHQTGFTKRTFMPNKKVRFVLLVIANVANMAMLLFGLCLYSVDATDFGSFLLLILMGNAILHTAFYICMKLLHREKLCIEAIVYGLLSLAMWAISAVYFFDKATIWMVTPAESRNLNQDCVFLDFYDKHDVWHLMSAPALYFTFMLLLCLDDDLVKTPQENIPVF